MKICVFGSGYVGLVAGTCFAESGNDVVCVDVDSSKVENLNAGICPIYEPGLEEMLKRNIKQKRLCFTTDAKTSIEDSQFLIIAVGTPPGEDGSADLRYVLKVAESIGTYMNDSKIIVTKSTVPVGTGDQIRKKVQSILKKRGSYLEFEVVSNPEFLKEGEAILDFTKPDRVVVGTGNPKTALIMKELYAPFMSEEDRLLIMDIRSAEMTKYASNSMLATKISFMNEIANLCESLGANVDHVRLGVGADSRIGHSFLFPGVGYGGSCFPKDVQALIRMGHDAGRELNLLQAVETVNDTQKTQIIIMIKNHFGDDLNGLQFGIWGLSFKPKTDDMREAASKKIVDGLLALGAKIIASDPAAMDEAKTVWGDSIKYKENYYEALRKVDALVIITEWSDYRRPDFGRMKKLMKEPVVFDGRNIYDPKKMKDRGFTYFSIGRPVF